MSGPPEGTIPVGPPVLLDARPDEEIPRVRGRRRALGRDPFADLDAEGLVDHALGQLRGSPSLAPPSEPATELRVPRLEELGPVPDPATAPLGLAGVDMRRLEALDRLVPRGHSVDEFGVSPASIRRALPGFLWLYRNWFRVRSEGHENLPSEGPAILVANHAGLLPFDGAMGVVDLFLHTNPPRLARTLVDRFVGKLPPLERFYSRVGQVVGTRERFRDLLRAGHLVLIFPEGVAGIRKTIAHRYRLQHFHSGFVREALLHGVPLIPVTFFGPENQAPVLVELRSVAKQLGLPALPITPTFPWLGPLGLVPYPVPYRIVYGAPIDLRQRFGPEAASDEAVVRNLADEIRRSLQHELDRRR